MSERINRIAQYDAIVKQYWGMTPKEKEEQRANLQVMLDKKLKLDFEFPPASSSFNSLYHIVSAEDWGRIRRRAYKDAGYQCEICKRDARLYCHEQWGYDESKRVQYLIGFQALCEDCHRIKHYGYSVVLARQGKVDLDRLVEHFVKVNEVEEYQFDMALRYAVLTWQLRTVNQWTVDYGFYQVFIDEDKVKELEMRRQHGYLGEHGTDDRTHIYPLLATKMDKIISIESIRFEQGSLMEYAVVLLDDGQWYKTTSKVVMRQLREVEKAVNEQKARCMAIMRQRDFVHFLEWLKKPNGGEKQNGSDN